MDKTIIIRPATKSDTKVVYDISILSFTDPWTTNKYDKLLENENMCFLCAVLKEQEKEDVVGYIMLDIPKASIVDLAVHPAMRMNGIGTSLLNAIIKECENRGLTSVDLSVRKSNINAHRLYEKLGFVDVEFRKKYFKRPIESGIIMERKILI